MSQLNFLVAWIHFFRDRGAKHKPYPADIVLWSNEEHGRKTLKVVDKFLGQDTSALSQLKFRVACIHFFRDRGAEQKPYQADMVLRSNEEHGKKESCNPNL